MKRQTYRKIRTQSHRSKAIRYDSWVAKGVVRYFFSLLLGAIFVARRRKKGNLMAKIMIVDDSAFMRMQLEKLVIELGHVVVAKASNGAEAVALCEEVKPDLVTLDITMPDMNGIEAACEIRKMNSDVKIIMCSAMGQQRMIIESIQAGANDFVVKPFQKDRIQEAIDKVLGLNKRL